jgi:thioredoxin 1
MPMLGIANRMPGWHCGLSGGTDFLFLYQTLPMNAFQELIVSDKPVLVDFTATWCGPCKMMSPVLEQVKRMLGDRITIIKIDIDKSPQTAGAYQIQGVPTLLLFRQGNIKWRQSGVVSAQSLVQSIDPFLN